MPGRWIAVTLLASMIAALVGYGIWDSGREHRPRRHEGRELSQIIVADRETALAVSKRLAAGEDFAALAEEQRSDAYWKLYTREEFATLTSAEAARAAFATKEGENTPPVETPYGWQIVHVGRIHPPHR